MSKFLYVAVDPDGGQHTRTSHRLYTHAVLVQSINWKNSTEFLERSLANFRSWSDDTESKAGYIAEYEALLAAATDEPSWFAGGFCGRYDLAVKAAAKYQKNPRVLRVAIEEAVAT